MKGSEIRDRVFSNIGRFFTATSDARTLLYLTSMVNEAFRMAMVEHPFSESIETTIIERHDDEERRFDVPSDIEIAHTIGVIFSRGTDRYRLLIKDNMWWSINILGRAVVTEEEGFPRFAVKRIDHFEVDKNVKATDKLLYLYSKKPNVVIDGAGSTDEVIIPVLHNFVVQYATAMMFLRIEDIEKYREWYRMSVGTGFDNGKIGGSLQRAINADRYSTVKDERMEPSYTVRSTVDVGELISSPTTADSYPNLWY